MFNPGRIRAKISLPPGQGKGKISASPGPFVFSCSMTELDAPLIASLEDEMNKLIIVSVIATVIAANFVGRKLRGAASN
jgi:hypothetical protein